MATNKNIKINLDYSSFTGGIKECQSKMSMLNAQFELQKAQMGETASETDKLTLAQSKLQQQITLQEQIVEQAAAKLAKLSTSEGTTERQVDAAQKAFIKQSTTLQNLKNELEGVDEKLDSLAQAEEEVGQSAQNGGFNQMSDSLSSLVGNVVAVVSAISTAVNVIDENARAAAGAADDIATLATQYGVSAEKMEEWVAISGLTDVSAETIGSAMQKLTRNMESAQSGSGTAAEAFDRLGVSFETAGGNLRSAEDVFYDVVDALSEMDNSAEQDAVAMDLLGRNASNLAPIIEMGSDAFKELANSAQGSLLGDFSEDLLELQDDFDKFDNAMELGTNELVGYLAPAIEVVLNLFTNMDPATLATVAAIRQLFSVVSALSPILQMMATVQTAANTAELAAAAASTTDAAATSADAAAKEVDAVATETATAANTGFVASLVAAAPAIAEIVLSIAAMAAAFAAVGLAIAAIIAAIALLAEAISKLISLFQRNSEAAEDATKSIKGYSDAAQNITIASSNASQSTSYMAMGSTDGGAGGLTWVGEQGAELVKLPYGSTVYNHEQSTQMASSSVNNYYVTIDAKNVNDFNKVVKVFGGLNQSMNRGGLVNG